MGKSVVESQWQVGNHWQAAGHLCTASQRAANSGQAAFQQTGQGSEDVCFCWPLCNCCHDNNMLLSWPWFPMPLRPEDEDPRDGRGGGGGPRRRGWGDDGGFRGKPL